MIMIHTGIAHDHLIRMVSLLARWQCGSFRFIVTYFMVSSRAGLLGQPVLRSKDEDRLGRHFLVVCHSTHST